MAAYVGVPTGHKAAARGRADGVLDVALVEAHALRGQPVDIGRPSHGAAIATDALGAQFVGIEDDDVHRLIGHRVLTIPIGRESASTRSASEVRGPRSQVRGPRSEAGQAVGTTLVWGWPFGIIRGR